MSGHHTVRVILAIGSLVATLSMSTGCSQTPAPRVQLSPDSAEVLELALLRVRPAYATQSAAIRAGLYRQQGEGAVPERRAPEPGPPAADGWVVQIAAYDTRAEARQAVRAAEGRWEASWEVRIERGPGVFRVAVGTWSTPAGAEAALRRIRRHHPDAWVRRAGEPIR